MPPVVPPALAGTKRLVVGVLALEDPLLDADVARDPISGAQQLVRRDEPSETPVAIGHGMDRQEVEGEDAEEHEWVGHLGVARGVVPLDQLREHELGLLPGHGREDLLPAAILVVADDLVVLALEVSAPRRRVTVELTVQVQDQRHGEPLRAVGTDQAVDRVAVAGELLLIAVAHPGRRTRGEVHRAVSGHLVSFDRGRGADRLDAGLGGEADEQFRQLVSVEILPAPTDVDPPENDAKPRRLERQGLLQVLEALHGTKDTIMPLKDAPD